MRKTDPVKPQNGACGGFVRQGGKRPTKAPKRQVAARVKGLWEKANGSRRKQRRSAARLCDHKRPQCGRFRGFSKGVPKRRFQGEGGSKLRKAPVPKGIPGRSTKNKGGLHDW